MSTQPRNSRLTLWRMASGPDNSEKASAHRLYDVWATIVVAMVLYVLPLIAVAIDELVLGTYWLVSHFPEGSRTVFFRIYPFIGSLSDVGPKGRSG